MSDDLRALRECLRGRYGVDHEHHAELTSTNDRALEWLRDGAPHGAVVTADAQTSGRGRRGREWISEPGQGLLVSLLLRPGPPSAPGGLGALGLAVGVGLREGLPTSSPPVMLKWPNDLLVGGRKLGGILCEARWIGDRPEIVVGFGINVRAGAVPASLWDRATCLSQHAPRERLHRATLLAELLDSLEHALEPFLREGFAAVRDRYLPWCEVLGRTIEVGDAAAPAGARRGIAERLDDVGALWVRPTDGPAFRVDSADVWLAPGADAGPSL